MKKIVSLILALAMIFALGITASAATITVDGTPGAKYAFYRVCSAAISKTDANKYAYTIDPDFVGFFETDMAGAKVYTTEEYNKDYIPVYYVGSSDGKTKVCYLKVTDDNVAEFGKALKAYAETNKIAAKINRTAGENGMATTPDLTLGYWLVTSDQGVCVMTTTNNESVTVHEKNVHPTIDKKVAIINKDTLTDEDYAEFQYVEYGETVRFKMEVPVGKGFNAYVINDDCGDVDEFEVLHTTETLSYVDKDGNIIALTEGTDYEYSSGNITWTISDSFDYEKATKFIVTIDMKPMGYVPELGYDNKVRLEYSDGTDDYETEWDDAYVYGGGIRVLKTAESKDGDRLGGAEFVVQNSDGKTSTPKYAKFDTDAETLTWVDSIDDATKFTTVDADPTAKDELGYTIDGKVTIKGLRYGETYWLKETKAPNGYNLLTEPQKVTITATSAQREAYSLTENSGFFVPENVINVMGTNIPGTGGIGTTLFYILGSLMAVGALVVLVTNKRVRV